MACSSALQLRKEKLPRFCRVCASELNQACEIENNPTKPELPLLIKRYMPEIDIKVENASLCTDCVSVLYTFHNFKRKCLRTEQDIHLHIRKHPEVEALNLNTIFVTKEQTNTIDAIEPSVETTATTEEPIREEPISDTELCVETAVVPTGTINEETTEPSFQAVTTSTTTTKVICELCFRGFPSRETLLRHKQKCQKRECYQCDKCSRNFTSKKVYDTHVAYHEQPDAILHTCKICNFVYQFEHSLSAHISSKHSSDDQKPFKCEVCTKRFAQKSTLTEHMRTHSLEKLYICSICNKTTAVQTELGRHITKSHNGKAKIKLMCTGSDCRRVFSSEKALEAHKRKFHRNGNERKRYQCDQCSREFPFEKPYHEHVEFHKKPGAGRYTCKTCNFVYHGSGGLRSHNIAKHTSDDKKPFQCEVCSMRFLDKTRLTEHIRTHTGEKPYQCPLCRYAATDRSSVYKHVSKRHTTINV